MFDDEFFDLEVDFLVSNVFRVLGGNDNGMNSEGLDVPVLTLVLNSDLSFGVRLQPGDNLFFETLPESFAEHVGVEVGEGHELFAFVGSVADHEALVPRSLGFRLEVIQFQRLVNVGRLLVDVHYHSAVSEFIYCTCSPFLSSRRHSPLALSPVSRFARSLFALSKKFLRKPYTCCSSHTFRKPLSNAGPGSNTRPKLSQILNHLVCRGDQSKLIHSYIKNAL